MEKVIVVLMQAEPDDDLVPPPAGPVTVTLLEPGLPGFSSNVRDSTHSMTLTMLVPLVGLRVCGPSNAMAIRRRQHSNCYGPGL